MTYNCTFLQSMEVEVTRLLAWNQGHFLGNPKTFVGLLPLLLEQGQEEGQGPELALPQETVVLKDPMSLARLWGRALEGLPLKVHRYYFRSYPDTFEGLSLVSWLISGDSQATSR